MLSFVLPLTILAIALTPIVASAGAAYKRELSEHDRRFNDCFDDSDSNAIGSVELNH